MPARKATNGKPAWPQSESPETFSGLSMDTHEKYQTREFEILGIFTGKKRRIILVSSVLLIFFLVAFALYASDFRIQKALVGLGITVLVLGTISVIEIPLLNLIMRKPKVLVDEDKLIRQCGKKQQILLWTDIARITIIENKNGIVNQIRIYPKKPKMAMHLHGYQEMEDLASLIKERTSDKGVVHLEKRWKLDWDNPFIGAPVALVPTMVIMFIVASMGDKAMDIFAVSMAFIVSLWILIFRPFTKLNASGKWVDLFFGIVPLGIGIYALIYYLLFGKMP
jgi:hypothetical protein